MTRKALGRGLSALLRETEATPPAASSTQAIPIDRIDPNPFQPRQAFPEAGLQELADSIRASGVVQPILVRATGERYQLVAGERRWRAALAAGLDSIPGVVRELSDREALELSLTENMMREDLSPIDLAHGLKTLQDTYGLTHEEMSERLGASRATITNTLRLLRLPPEIQQAIVAGGISTGHARALLTLEFHTDQLRAAAQIAKHALSVREAEELVAKWNKAREARRPKKEVPVDANVRAAQLELERALGTRVKIVGNGQRGHIEIRYFSEADLNRIYDWILRR